MRAKDFLQQVAKLDKLIENKLIEIQQLKALADNTTGNMTGDRVQTTRNPNRIPDAICRYIDIEQEIKGHVDEYIRAKQRVISVIEQLSPTEYDILHKIYVQGLTMYDVADKYDRTYSWVTTIHGRALKNVQKILNDSERRNNGE